MAKKARTEDDAAPVKARVLVKTHIDGELFHPDTVVAAPPAAIKALEDQGLVDSDEDAVAYAESLKPADSAE